MRHVINEPKNVPATMGITSITFAAALNGKKSTETLMLSFSFNTKRS